MSELKERLEVVLEKIQQASGGRDDVKLIAVSKTKPVQMILDAYEAGQVLFGENKVQEARDKRAVVPDGVDLHLIGPLQKNKAKYCPKIFSTIHTIHRLDVVELLNKRCQQEDKNLDVLIQMNLTGEETKSGIRTLDQLKALSDQIMEFDRIRLTGLMTIGDPAASDSDNQKVFAQLAEIREKEARRLNLENQFIELSTGMSADFELALKEGATYVRIGSAIFGERDYGNL